MRCVNILLLSICISQSCWAGSFTSVGAPINVSISINVKSSCSMFPDSIKFKHSDVHIDSHTKLLFAEKRVELKTVCTQMPTGTRVSRQITMDSDVNDTYHTYLDFKDERKKYRMGVTATVHNPTSIKDLFPYNDVVPLDVSFRADGPDLLNIISNDDIDNGEFAVPVSVKIRGSD